MKLDAIGPVGVDVSGIDLTRPLDATTADALRSAWRAHGLLCFRDQPITPEDQVRLASCFGAPYIYPFRPALAGHPHVIRIVKTPQDRTNFGGGWHTDGSWQREPTRATVLRAIEVPPRGGDTLFADTAAAFRDLSAAMQQTLLDLTGIYIPELIHGAGARHAAIAGDQSEAQENSVAVPRGEVEHPIIVAHPETGAPSIYCTPVHTHRIKGWSRAESLPLFEFLMTHATQSKYVTRLTWRTDTVVVWDNARLFHNALNDYPGMRREMHRVIVRGTRPLPLPGSLEGSGHP